MQLTLTLTLTSRSASCAANPNPNPNPSPNLCSSARDFDELCASCAEIFRRTLPAFTIGDAPPYYPSAGDAAASANDEDEDLVVV